MKHFVALFSFCICTGLFALASSAQDSTNAAALPAASTNAVSQPPIPEEARKHFVMGTTLFKDAKTPDDYSQVVSEFKQATDLAPQWPEARYNLALAKEAAGDYSGAMDDLKLYQQFKLSDDEARTVQDKIYALEAKSEEAAKKAAEEQAKAKQIAAQLAGRWDFGNSTLPQQIIISGSDGDYRGEFTRQWSSGNVQLRDFKANGRNVNFSLYFDSGPGTYWAIDDYSLTLSDDGNKLTGTFSFRSNNPVTQYHTEDASLSRQ
jgi:tetratricopeptide (TPR) repeat protein